MLTFIFLACTHTRALKTSQEPGEPDEAKQDVLAHEIMDLLLQLRDELEAMAIIVVVIVVVFFVVLDVVFVGLAAILWGGRTRL